MRPHTPTDRTFHPRVAVVNSVGAHVRYITGAMAAIMVEGGSAAAAPGLGRVREVALARPASSHAVRIGEPGDGHATGVRFYRWVHLEQSASRVVEHHPRCLFVIEPDAE